MCDRKRDTYAQLLFTNSPYSALPLNKPAMPVSTSSYSPACTPPQSSTRHIMLNSPLKTPPQSCLDKLDITAHLDAISAELRDIGSLGSSPDLSRALHMSTSKEEMTLQSIGEKIMQSPDQSFAFPSAFSQTNIKRELSDLPKLQGGQFLIKFGDSLVNKFTVNTEEVQLPGGYSSLQADCHSVLLDVARMEIYSQTEHRATVGYPPKPSIPVSLYQSVGFSQTTTHNQSPFAAVQNSRFSASFLKILQQGVRDVVGWDVRRGYQEWAEEEEESLLDVMATTDLVLSVSSKPHVSVLSPMFL